MWMGLCVCIGVTHINKVLLFFLRQLLVSKDCTNLWFLFCRIKLCAARENNDIESLGVGQAGGEVHPIPPKIGGHFTFPNPSGLLPVSVPGSNLVPVLTRLCKGEGTEDENQVAFRYLEVLPESCNLGSYSASFICLFALSKCVLSLFCLRFFSCVLFDCFFPLASSFP